MKTEPAPLGRTPLRAFISGECASATPGDGCIVYDRAGCRVLRGGRCAYFEASVYPLAARYPGADEAYRTLHPQADLPKAAHKPPKRTPTRPARGP